MFLTKKIFWPKKFLDPKKLLTPKIFLPQNSAPTMVCICGKSPNSDFFDQTGPKKVRIYLKKSAFLNFPSILNLRIRRSSLNIAPMTFYQKIDPT